MLKALPILLRLILGSIFLFYGLDAFFHFVPNQTVSEPAGKFISALIDSGYLWTLTKVGETIGGLMLLTDFFVPLALVLIAPIVVNIFCFHLFLNPSGWAIGIYPVGVTIVIAELGLAWFYREYFQGLFVAKAIADVPQTESNTVELTE